MSLSLAAGPRTNNRRNSGNVEAASEVAYNSRHGPDQAVAVERTLTVVVPNELLAGEYSVWVSVGTNDGTPVYAMPLSDDHGSRRYLLGKLAVVQ